MYVELLLLDILMRGGSADIVEQTELMRKVAKVVRLMRVRFGKVTYRGLAVTLTSYIIEFYQNI